VVKAQQRSPLRTATREFDDDRPGVMLPAQATAHRGPVDPFAQPAVTQHAQNLLARRVVQSDQPPGPVAAGGSPFPGSLGSGVAEPDELVDVSDQNRAGGPAGQGLPSKGRLQLGDPGVPPAHRAPCPQRPGGRPAPPPGHTAPDPG
jgi:hypothetical protein